MMESHPSRSEKLKASSDRCRPPRLLWVPPVDPRQEITELRRRDRHHTLGRARPDEASPLQALREQTGALAVMPDDLQKIAPTTAEAKQVAAKRVAMQDLLNLQCQRRKALPHVGMAGREPYPHAGRQRDHRGRPSASAATTALSVAASTAPVIRIRAPAANSISIAPQLLEGAVNGWRSGAIETAAKRASLSCCCIGSGPQARTPVRACRRQAVTRLR